MNTSEMHVMFRQYAQQMGMQNVRAILPEQIDLLLNTSQMDMVNQIIKENIGITNDRVITDNSKIGQINALRSLYHVALIDMSPSTKGRFGFIASDRNTGKMSTETGNDASTSVIPEYMFLVDFAINYKKVSNQQGYSGTSVYSAPVFAADSLETNYFPVRIIDDAYLADTLNDFVLKNRLRTPIIVTYNIGTGTNKKTIFDLYIDKFNKVSANGTDKYVLQGDLIPYKLRMSYIGKPSKIEYLEDVGGTNKETDLPEYMHIDLVKHAVDLYHTAVQGNMMAAQQQEQNAQREAMRNNYRNEGNAPQQ